MGWILFFSLVLYLGFRKSSEGIKKSDLGSDFEIQFPDPKDLKPEPFNKESSESVTFDALQHMKIGNQPIRCIAEVCDSCDQSYYIFVAQEEIKRDISQIYCPFCGKVHLQDRPETR